MKNVKKRLGKKMFAVFVLLSMIVSLIAEAPLSNNRVEAADNPLFGKKIVAMDNSDYTGALTDEGELYIWGSAMEHFHGMNLKADYPNKILDNIKEFELGWQSNLDRSIALSNDGIVYSWDEDSAAEIILKDIKDIGIIGVGASHCTYYALGNDNSLYTFDDERYLGRYVDEDNENDSKYIPQVVLSDVESIISYNDNSKLCGAITNTGDLYIWGEEQVSPKKVASEVEKAQIGNMLYDGFVCFWKQTGSLCIGKLDDNMVMEEVKEITEIRDITNMFLDCAYKAEKCYVLTKNKDVYLIDAREGQLIQNQPILKDIKKMSFNGNVFTAISSSNDLYMWCGGSETNYYGIMGDGTREDKPEYKNPQLIMTDVDEIDIAGDMRVLVKKTNGDVYQWGRESYGGFGTIQNSYTPVKYMSNADAIVYLDGSLAGVRTQDGNYYMWGLNFSKDILFNDEEIVYSPYCITTTNGFSGSDDVVDPSVSQDPDDPARNLTPSPIESISPLPDPEQPDISTPSQTPAPSAKMVYKAEGNWTGWGGTDSYPSAAGHEQGDGTGNTYDPSLTNMVVSSGYLCGLELMNPYNPVFAGADNEMAVFIKKMKQPVIRVTLKNGGAASGWNWSTELSLPSGKEVPLTTNYLKNNYFVLFGNDDTITKVEIYDAYIENQTAAPSTTAPKQTMIPDTGTTEPIPPSADQSSVTETAAPSSAATVLPAVEQPSVNTPVPSTKTSTPSAIRRNTYTVKAPSRPAKGKIKKGKALRGGKVKLTWKRISGAYKYQIQYSTKRSFAGRKTISAYGKSTTLFLKSKKTYYIRVRALKYGNSATYYEDVKGRWSAVKKIKTK